MFAEVATGKYPRASADTCSGDSGGPLFLAKGLYSREDVQVGIVSFGDTVKCRRGKPNDPGEFSEGVAWVDTVTVW